MGKFDTAEENNFFHDDNFFVWINIKIEQTSF